MASDIELFARVARRYREEVQIVRDLVQARFVGAMYATSLVLAFLTGLALRDLGWWIAVALLLAGVAVWWRRLRTIANAVAARLDAEQPLDTTMSDDDRARMSQLPAYQLLPHEITSAARLEEHFNPSATEIEGSSRLLVPERVAAHAARIAVIAGSAIGVIIPAVLILLDFTRFEGIRAWMIVGVIASLPLSAVEYTRRSYARIYYWLAVRDLNRAQDELARLWRADPSFAEGRVVLRGSDRYAIDHGGLNNRLYAARSKCILCVISQYGTVLLVSAALVSVYVRYR